MAGFSFAKYQSATRDSGGSTPGAKALAAYCRANWGFITRIGIYKNRKVAGSKTLSHHAEGRALDIMIPVLRGGIADVANGMQIVNTLGAHGKRLGIDQLIFNRTIWSGRKPAGRPYKGKHPHYDHIHLGLSRNAGRNLNLATLEAVIGGATTTATTLERVTHRVAASSLKVRREPSTSAASVAELLNGAPVEELGEAPKDSDGYRWVKIRAAAGGRLVDGWVASDYLESTSPAPSGPATLERVTHRVTASSLYVRREPSTSAATVAELPNAAPVEELGEVPRDSDGYSWVKIRAAVDEQLVEGWVASDFLESTAPAPSGGTKLERVTHRVTASSLYVRREPSTSAATVAELPKGAEVQDVGDAPKDSDGYMWVKIWAAPGGQLIEGWVAADYLESM